MTSLSTIGADHQHIEGRTVRDIVEYSPGQVNEVWCRKIFRQVLQSLELQYGMRMPHRPITPDTIVFHDNGEPLLVPTPGTAADGELADDLRRWHAWCTTRSRASLHRWVRWPDVPTWTATAPR
ncbi:hypothetical protein [Massilia sp. TN1-12]|uniref:hypothetical protein n=1 Tax=Massilia paldalensis TaxID=3377675 RepID=UPI00384AEB45